MAEEDNQVLERLVNRIGSAQYEGMAGNLSVEQVIGRAAVMRIARVAAQHAMFLRKEFLEYANHKPGCPGGDGNRCPCGYLQIFNRIS